jgi:hypothetical protein
MDDSAAETRVSQGTPISDSANGGESHPSEQSKACLEKFFSHVRFKAGFWLPDSGNLGRVGDEVKRVSFDDGFPETSGRADF